jgi:hypothetical protein
MENTQRKHGHRTEHERNYKEKWGNPRKQNKFKKANSLLVHESIWVEKLCTANKQPMSKGRH